MVKTSQLTLIHDRFFCSYWAGVGFPYLHGVWHILIFLSSYSSIVLFAYCDVVNHMPDKTPILKYVIRKQDEKIQALTVASSSRLS